MKKEAQLAVIQELVEGRLFAIGATWRRDRGQRRLLIVIINLDGIYIFMYLSITILTFKI